MSLDDVTITGMSVKRIIKVFGREFRIPVPLWYPKWKHKSEWTLKEGKKHRVSFDVNLHGKATNAQIRGNVKKVAKDLLTNK